MRVRRSRHLISYWTDQGNIVCNYATGESVLADSLVSHVLSLCADWISDADLRKPLARIPRKEVDALFASMVEHSLLVRADRPADARERALGTWSHWNPAAGFFHFSTKNMPVPANREATEAVLRKEREAGRKPPRVKRYARASSVALPRGRRGSEFPDVLLGRRTWRSFSTEPVAMEDVATLLDLACGVQRKEESVTAGDVDLKTSPSSGARQPLEAYLLAVNVRGLAPGLYHYASDRHGLELLRKGADAQTIAAYIPGQWWYESAAALFMLTAVFARTQWRYRFPRAYRSVLLEAGHVCQTFCLVATWLGLAPFCTGRFADAVVERAIKADGITESFIYGAGVGARPPGVEWAPWPIGHSAEHPLMRPE